jgi:hypothetical protein
MELTTKYAIGDTVYRSGIVSSSRRLPCPDCLDTRKWFIRTPAGLETEVVCQRCASGHYARDLPSLTVQDWRPHVESLTIGSARIDTADETHRRISYMCLETGVGSGAIYYETDLHPTRKAAWDASATKADLENIKLATCPDILRAEQFSRLALDIAIPTIEWRKVYDAFAHARWLRETIEEVIIGDDVPGSRDEIVEYLQTRLDELDRYEFIKKHPVQMLIDALRESEDGVTKAALSAFDAEYPPLPPSRAEIDGIEGLMGRATFVPTQPERQS